MYYADCCREKRLTRKQQVSFNIVPISCLKCYFVIAFNITQVEYLVDNLQDNSIFETKIQLILFFTVSTI